ncbi:hypothetical protein RHI9324_03133 [Rhizobium sp. CECT 9324]|nr:hypothetical protein RHI9324_03133 [Rhizobium sp. CECT 9324]
MVTCLRPRPEDRVGTGMRDTIYCVICVLLTLALTALSMRYVTELWIFSFFFSLQLQISVIVLAGTVICLLVKRGTYAWMLLAASLALIGHSLWMKREFVPSPLPPEVVANAPRLRILSFNVLNDNVDNAKKIADMIQGSQADVVYIMEANPLFGELDRLGETYPYRIGCGIETPTCDLMMLSKHPIRAGRYDELSDLRADRFAEIEIEVAGRRISLLAAHLSKPYFDDYHSIELDNLILGLNDAKGSVILAGDFNSDSIAPDMQRFLRRSGLRKVGAEPATWPVEAGLAGIPIDHIFVDKDIAPLSLKRLDESYGSNHFGLVADVALIGEVAPDN